MEIFVSQDSVSKLASWNNILIFLGTGLFSSTQQTLKSKTNIFKSYKGNKYMPIKIFKKRNIYLFSVACVIEAVDCDTSTSLLLFAFNSIRDYFSFNLMHIKS